MANDLLCGQQAFLPARSAARPRARAPRPGARGRRATQKIENWISPSASQWFWQPDSDAVSEEVCPDMAVSSGLKRQVLGWVKEVAFFYGPRIK
jgi:hypothetical protein